MGYPSCGNDLLNLVIRNLTQIREGAVQDQKENVHKSAVYAKSILEFFRVQQIESFHCNCNDTVLAAIFNAISKTRFQ